MSDIAQRIGQVVWPAIRASRGVEGLDALTPLLERYPPGGVIVFGENLPGVEPLIAELRRRAPDDLLVACDLERGCGQHVKERTSLPPAMAIAAGGNVDAAYEAAMLTAIEAREAGIDVVFAPVVDVNTAATNPIIATRSFGDDPHAVARYASAFAKGLQDGGVLAVAKHFPGHGCTLQDSHNVLATVTRTPEELEAIDLVPFRTLIAEDVGGVMVGHLATPALDPVPDRPATLSPNVVLDVLRRQLGFEGFVVTDAMDMGGFPQDDDAALAVLQSGHDVLLMPRDPLATCEGLERAHARKHLPDEVLDAAVGRIAAVRERLARRADLSALPRPDADLPRRLWAASLTSRGELPIASPGRRVALDVFGDDDSGVVVGAFQEALEALGLLLEPGPAAEPPLRVGLVLTSVAAWLGTSRLDERQRARLTWALEHDQLDVVVILGSPYELLDLPGSAPALLAYEATPSGAQHAALVLTGKAAATGRLPVGGGSDLDAIGTSAPRRGPFGGGVR